MLQLYRRTRRSASSSTEDKALLSVRANVGASAGAGAGNSTSPISDGASPTRSTSAAAASSSTAALTASTSTSAIWSIRPSDAQRIALDRLLRLYPDADPGYLAHCLSHYKSSSQNQSQNQGQSQEAGPSSPTSPTTPTFRKRSGSKARSVREYAGSVGGNGGGAGQEYPNDNTKTEGRAGTEVGIEARELVARVGEKVRDANWGIYPTAVWDCARDGSGRTQVDVVRTRNRDL